MQKYYGEILFFIVTLFAAAGWFVSKAALAELPPAGFLSIRFMVASLLFLPFALPHFRQFSRQQIAQAACISLAFSGNIFLVDTRRRPQPTFWRRRVFVKPIHATHTATIVATISQPPSPNLVAIARHCRLRTRPAQ